MSRHLPGRSARKALFARVSVPARRRHLRRIALSQSQPACNTNTVTGLIDCGNWGVSAVADLDGAARIERAATSLVELAHALQRAMGSRLELEFGPPRGVNAVTRRQANVSRAGQRLGWKPEVDLDEGLRQLVAWWRAERAPADEAGVR